MDSLAIKILLGLVITTAIALFGLFIYGIISKDIQGTNFYLFKTNTGDSIVGGISIAGGIFTLAVGVWYYISHKEDFQNEHLKIHKNLLNEGDKSKKLMNQAQKELALKNINILIIFILFSFFFIFMGASCFLNEESVPSLFQAYERPCPKNTVPASAQKHPKDLL